MSEKRAVVILEVMWDWNARTSAAGYVDRAPKFFFINPQNFTGRRLHKWLKDYPFVVTNACPELVNSAKGRGTPDKAWLKQNLTDLHPFGLLLVCGKVAQATYDKADAKDARIIELLHPAARCWNQEGINLVHTAIQSDAKFQSITFKAGKFTLSTTIRDHCKHGVPLDNPCFECDDHPLTTP